MKRSLRGLYVIRGGAPFAALVDRAKKPMDEKPDETDEDEQAAAADDGRLGTLEVNFSQFNTWYEINSWWEGRFLERTAAGAFKKTIAERGSQVKVLFNHGMDMTVGDMPISYPEVIEERKDGPFLSGPLLRGTPELLVEGLRAGVYGSSFMFEVLGESWNREPDASEDNPDALPERTISEVRLFEAGPVTWPANPDATAGMRSGMDWYAEQVQQRDRGWHDDLVRSFEAFRALNGLGTPQGAADPGDARPVPPTPAVSVGRHVAGVTAAARRRRLTLIDMAEAIHDSGGAA